MVFFAKVVPKAETNNKFHIYPKNKTPINIFLNIPIN